MAHNYEITEGSGQIMKADDVGSDVLAPHQKLDLGTTGNSVLAVAGAGAVGTGVQRMTLASDDPAVVDLAAMEALLITIDSDTNTIQSDTTGILADTAALVIDAAAMEALLITIDSDTNTIQSDTTAILADTAAMVIDLAAIEVAQDAIVIDLAAIEVVLGTIDADTSAMVTDLAAIEALLITIDSDTNTIQSDTTAILADTAALVIDAAAIEVLLGTIDTDTGAMVTDLAAIEVLLGTIDTDTGAMVTDLAAIEVLLGTIDSDTNIIQGDTTAIQAAVEAIDGAIIGPGEPTVDSYATVAINVGIGADSELVAIPGANKQIWVYGYKVVAGTADATSVLFEDEDDTAFTGVMLFPQYGGATVAPSGNFSMPIFKVTTNKALDINVGGGEVDGWLAYAIVDVT